MNEARFNIVYKLYWTCLYGYAFKILKNDVDAEEMVIRAFERLWDKRDSFVTSQDKQIKVYLWLCVRSNCYKFISNKRIIYTENILVYDFKFTDSHESTMIAADFLNQMMDAIEELPAQQKKVIKMILDGKSTQHIADVLKIKNIYVHSSKHKAVLAIRELLKIKIKNHKKGNSE